MFNQAHKIDGYSYYISNDSDDEVCHGSDSSEDEKKFDEIDVFLHGTAEQKRKAFQRLTGDEASSSEDEFEKMMKEELNDKMALHEQTWMAGVNTDDRSGNPSTSQDIPTSSTADTYDEIYFDSDEDMEDARVKAKKKKLSNDELFYDPFADERNEKWAKKQRLRGSAVIKQKTKNTSSDKDNVLTCPACLTTLCMDCQRHEIYKEQYRAMFVMNCKVLSDEVLRYKEPKKKKFKRHRRQEAAAQASAEDAGFVPAQDSSADESVYHPVKCEKCDTEVAVYDKDEVYHFFNVIAGPA